MEKEKRYQPRIILKIHGSHWIPFKKMQEKSTKQPFVASQTTEVPKSWKIELSFLIWKRKKISNFGFDQWIYPKRKKRHGEHLVYFFFVSPTIKFSHKTSKCTYLDIFFGNFEKKNGNYLWAFDILETDLAGKLKNKVRIKNNSIQEIM